MVYVILVVAIIVVAAIIIRKKTVGNIYVYCVRCLVRLERQETDYAYYRMVVHPDVYFKVPNGFHIRLIENCWVLPETFNILAPYEYVSTIEGYIPQECHLSMSVTEYVSIRKKVYGS